MPLKKGRSKEIINPIILKNLLTAGYKQKL